jgi:hypothetical protein
VLNGWVTSSGPKGVRIIADLEILTGIAYIFLGFFLLIYFAISGVSVVAIGLILIYMGWALDKLESWAWWGSLLLNGMMCVGNIVFAGEYLLIVLSIVIIIYLLTPGVRGRFFQ